MTNLELRIAEWHQQKYGGPVKVAATYRKLLEEVGELGQALMNEDAKNVREEAGDVAFVLCHLLRGACPAHPSLIEALRETLDKCEERENEKAKS